MLVLTRRMGEEIVIDDDIRITVLSLRGNCVRLGIAAPLNIAIDRSELIEQSGRVPQALRLGEVPRVRMGANS